MSNAADLETSLGAVLTSYALLRPEVASARDCDSLARVIFRTLAPLPRGIQGVNFHEDVDGLAGPVDYTKWLAHHPQLLVEPEPEEGQ